MKKIVLKYLPIAIALLLVGGCFLSLNIYKKNYAEYAVFSYSSDKYSYDMKISESGKITSLEAANRLSYENADSVKRVIGMDVSDAAAFLEETLGDRIVIVTVTAAEKNEIPTEKLKELVERASSALTISHISAYGDYTESNMNRVNTFELSLGRIATITVFANYCSQNIANCYVDSYAASPADLESLAYYVNYVKNEVLTEEQAANILLDTSKVSFTTEYVTVEDAQKLIDKGSETWYGEPVDDFKYVGISFDSGKLKHKFSTFFYGYESHVYVSMEDGVVFFDDEGY
jgi:hypothetical protein